MITVEKTIDREIMNTVIYFAVSSDSISKNVIESDIQSYINGLKDFEQKYSRFIKGNILDSFNNSEVFSASNEFIDILLTAQMYYQTTGGIFNPAVINSLINEGYGESFEKNQISHNTNILPINLDFAKIEIDKNTNTVKKHPNLKLDLGGIGKGYIADKIAQKILTKYSDFCVSLGGDMYLGGKDQKFRYSYWAIEIDNSDSTYSFSTPTLLLTDKAVATSGINKRKWFKNNDLKHHLIDTKTGLSAETDIVTATVIGDSVTFSDITAKILVIMGFEAARSYCENNSIPAVICSENGSVFITKDADKYVWEE